MLTVGRRLDIKSGFYVKVDNKRFSHLHRCIITKLNMTNVSQWSATIRGFMGPRLCVKNPFQTDLKLKYFSVKVGIKQIQLWNCPTSFCQQKFSSTLEALSHFNTNLWNCVWDRFVLIHLFIKSRTHLLLSVIKFSAVQPVLHLFMHMETKIGLSLAGVSHWMIYHILPSVIVLLKSYTPAVLLLSLPLLNFSAVCILPRGQV